MHDAPQSNRLSRPTSVKAPIIGRAGSGKVQRGPAPRSNWRRRFATSSRLRKIGLPSKRGAAKQRLGRARLHTWRVRNTWCVWRLREDFSRSELASWHQSTFFGRRAAQQRGAIAAALHGADGALGLLERRAQGLSRGGENHREQQDERGEGPHGEPYRSS